MANPRITAVINDETSIEMDMDMKTVTIRDADGDYFILTKDELDNIVNVVGSHAWAYGVTKESKDATDATRRKRET